MLGPLHRRLQSTAGKPVCLQGKAPEHLLRRRGGFMSFSVFGASMIETMLPVASLRMLLIQVSHTNL